MEKQKMKYLWSLDRLGEGGGCQRVAFAVGRSKSLSSQTTCSSRLTREFHSKSHICKAVTIPILIFMAWLLVKFAIWVFSASHALAFAHSIVAHLQATTTGCADWPGKHACLQHVLGLRKRLPHLQ